MLNKRLATGLLVGGLVFSGLMWAAPAMQPALAQQSATQQSAKTSTTATKASTTTSTAAKPAAAKPAAAKPTAAPTKKSAPKPLVYIVDNRNASKSADVPASSKTANASASKTGDASVKKASDTSASKTAASTGKASDTSSSQKPVSTDLTKAFQQNCPSVALTDSKAKAAYDVTFEREPGGKGVKSAFGLTNAVHKTSKIEVMNKNGKELFSETGHSTSQLVKDACTAIGTPGTKVAKN